MKNEEILKKAVEKAVKNGWKDFNELTSVVMQEGYPYDRGEKHLLQKCFGYIEMRLYPIHIFSHNFAKAFWGEEKVDKDNFRTICGPLETWQYHLQQMVLSEDPIKYLELSLSES